MKYKFIWLIAVSTFSFGMEIEEKAFNPTETIYDIKMFERKFEPIISLIARPHLPKIHAFLQEKCGEFIDSLINNARTEGEIVKQYGNKAYEHLAQNLEITKAFVHILSLEGKDIAQKADNGAKQILKLIIESSKKLHQTIDDKIDNAYEKISSGCCVNKKGISKKVRREVSLSIEEDFSSHISEVKRNNNPAIEQIKSELRQNYNSIFRILPDKQEDEIIRVASERYPALFESLLKKSPKKGIDDVQAVVNVLQQGTNLIQNLANNNPSAIQEVTTMAEGIGSNALASSSALREIYSAYKVSLLILSALGVNINDLKSLALEKAQQMAVVAAQHIEDAGKKIKEELEAGIANIKTNCCIPKPGTNMVLKNKNNKN